MEITAVNEQRVQPNSNVTFTEEVISGNNSIIHRPGSGLVKLRGLTSGCQCRARFKVFFNGNIAIPDMGMTPNSISIAISLDGEPVLASLMTVSPADTLRYFNVASSIYLNVPANCCSTIGVINLTSETDILVKNANLIVERVA